MLQTIHLPRYAYETLKNYDGENKAQLLFQVVAYLFEGVTPDLKGWDASLFHLMVEDLQTRENLIAHGGKAVERVLDE